MSATVLKAPSSWRAGFGNLARREAATWWSSGRWWRHALVWAAILAGLLTLMLWVMPALMEGTEGAATATGEVAETALQFPDLAAVIIAAGVVLLSQGIVLDERRNGVLEWLLSKPVARPAVVLAKFVGHGSGLIVSVVVVPWLAVHALLSVADGQLWNPLHSLGVVGILALVVAFHLALVLLLSTLTTSRVAILAIPIVAIVSADGITAVLPELFEVLPWSLGALASVLLVEGVVVSVWPILATLVWTVVLLAISAALLQRAEL
jgi:ABC-type transport system involved in multi-copper enzyme maturation permease subunit